MLLDPFEEQLDLPTVLVKCGDHQWRQGRVVGQKHQCLARLGDRAAINRRSTVAFGLDLLGTILPPHVAVGGKCNECNEYKVSCFQEHADSWKVRGKDSQYFTDCTGVPKALPWRWNRSFQIW
jgi:hypothetical protein